MAGRVTSVRYNGYIVSSSAQFEEFGGKRDVKVAHPWTSGNNEQQGAVPRSGIVISLQGEDVCRYAVDILHVHDSWWNDTPAKSKWVWFCLRRYACVLGVV